MDKLAHPPIDVGKQEIGVGDPIMIVRLLGDRCRITPFVNSRLIRPTGYTRETKKALLLLQRLYLVPTLPRGNAYEKRWMRFAYATLH